MRWLNLLQIEVESPEDVQYAFGFSKVSKIPLVIKNTGHDYKGRSSAPGSLALWMHKLKSITRDEKFVPEGCPADFAANDAVTMGAGVQWREAYQFADKHDITLAGGSDEAVGAVGGWLQGGGHGALSNTLGLGIDRVLQFKVVTPDGSYRTANACQNQDLFWALRGGGGGTFGVVMEATEKAAPKLTLQVMFLQWSKDDVEQSRKYTRQLFKILIDNGLKVHNIFSSF
jgi:FAD/FMN-containing dehydrogenase